MPIPGSSLMLSWILTNIITHGNVSIDTESLLVRNLRAPQADVGVSVNKVFRNPYQ